MTNVLQGAKFVIENKDTDYKYETTIDKKIEIPDIPEGDYKYTLSKTGYETNSGNITIKKGTNPTLKLILTKKGRKKASTKKANDKK